MPDRFLKRVQVTEDEKTTRVRYDIADFGEFRWMEARFGGWEQSKGLRFRIKIDIFGASKGFDVINFIDKHKCLPIVTNNY
uniref:WYL domain-containing protein n=1 Tax=Ascaris lumbricoides TaxID=6252 RepID=A0A0M3HT02_ASCLU